MKMAYYTSFPFYRILLERHQLSSLFESKSHTNEIGKADFCNWYLCSNEWIKKKHASCCCIQYKFICRIKHKSEKWFSYDFPRWVNEDIKRFLACCVNVIKCPSGVLAVTRSLF